jgi:hypothetical protein
MPDDGIAAPERLPLPTAPESPELIEPLPIEPLPIESPPAEAPPTEPLPAELVPAELVPVAFAGEEAGTGEMSWGQWDIWTAMVDQNSSLPLGGTAPVESGATMQDMADLLRYMITRYPAMRTRLRFDAAGRPSQEVFGSGVCKLEVYQAGEADPKDVALTVERRWRAAPFDYAGEWPIRMGVVLRDGAPAYLVSILCHLVVDAAGSEVMVREATARETAPSTGMTPLTQARWQSSPAGRRQNAAALRYWENTLRAVPPGRRPDSADKRSPRHWGGQLNSPALRLAVQAICDRTGAGSSPVLMALFGVALARVAGIGPAGLRMVVNNRFRPALADMVCVAAQNGICVLDVAGTTIDAAVGGVQRGAMAAYKHAYYDPEQVRALIQRVTEERGGSLDVERFFNDRRVEGRVTVTGPVTPERIKEALADTAFTWTECQDDPFAQLFLHADDAPGSIRLHILADTHFHGPAQLEALVREIEAAAVEAAFDPAAPTTPEASPGG